MAYQNDPGWPPPSSEQRPPVPEAASRDMQAGGVPFRETSSTDTTRRLWPLVTGPVAGLSLILAGFVFGVSILFSIGIIIVVLGIIGGIIGAALKPDSTGGMAEPLAYTDDGRPIYPVVGYTAEGTAITADRAVGYRPPNQTTNSLAIVALILGFVFPILAIPFGHVARSQIRKTGEQGDGIALAGLILGYFGLIAILVLIVIVAATSR